MLGGGVVFFVLAVFLAAESPVRVVHDACPSGAEVEVALASLLTQTSAASATRDVAQLDGGLNKLHLKLVGADGVVIAERTLDGGASCAELGRMAALVIASWESDVHPEFVRPPAEITRAPRARPPEPPAFAPAPSTTTTTAAAWDVAAGVTLGAANTLAAGSSLGGAWFPRGAGLGLWGLGAVDLGHTIAVGAHEARWRRWTASLELAHRWARGRAALDAHAGLTLGWLTTEGVDYMQNRSDDTASFGGTAGVRTAWWVSRRAALWIDLRGVYFPRRDSIYGGVGGAAVDEAPVPRWGGVVSAGVALGQAPVSR